MVKLQKKYERVGKEFAFNVLTKLNEVKAIAFEGAIARGFTDRYSDIDIICLCNNIPRLRNRTKLLRPLVSRLNDDYKVIPKKYFESGDYLEYKGRNIGITYKRIKDLKQAVRDFKNEKPAQLVDIITRAYYVKIIYDPQKIYSKLRASMPKSDITKIIERFLYHLSNITLRGEWPKWGLRAALYRKNLMAIDATFLEAIDLYLKLLYVINGEYFFVPKWAHKSIKELKIKPRKCWERIQIIFRLGNDTKSVKKKVKIFQGLMTDLQCILKRKLKK